MATKGMPSEDLIPIVVGVGDVKNLSLAPEDALEPMQLMLQAVQHAAQDTNLATAAAQDLLSQIDSLAVVKTWTWPYDDLPGLLAGKLGANPKHTRYTDNGGNAPARLFDEAACQISKGQSKVALVTGGEALASLGAYIAARKTSPKSWTKPAQSVTSSFKVSTDLLPPGIGRTHAIGMPTQIYAMYENSRRAHRGQSIRDNHSESAQLYASFAQIAAGNLLAWNYGKPPATESSISEVSKRNRMINFPYPLLMNAFNNVNLAAACLLTSVGYARELGIPESQWIYPLGGAGTSESHNFWERAYLHSSVCIPRTLDACLDASGLSKEDIDVFDFYSCFPIVPKLACDHLGLSITEPEKPISLLGGLTSFGGAGNNYSMHALTEMVRYIRDGKARHGLVLANGGTATYQHAVCLSSRARQDGSGYPGKNPLPDVVSDLSIPSVDDKVDGVAKIESYTVDFARNGQPTLGHILGRLTSNGHRFIANHGDASTLAQLASWEGEPIGRMGYVKTDAKGRNLFTFTKDSKL